MKHILKTEDICIEFEPEIFYADDSLPENTILHIYISSGNFTAKTYMDINIKDFSDFSEKLFQLYTDLKGTVRLHETYGEHNYFEFSGNGRGQILVTGCLDNHIQNGFTQELKFENIFDQTYLGCFSRELKNTYQGYK